MMTATRRNPNMSPFGFPKANPDTSKPGNAPALQGDTAEDWMYSPDGEIVERNMWNQHGKIIIGLVIGAIVGVIGVMVFQSMKKKRR